MWSSFLGKKLIISAKIWQKKAKRKQTYQSLEFSAQVIKDFLIRFCEKWARKKYFKHFLTQEGT
jgi:hypothetical protein